MGSTLDSFCFRAVNALTLSTGEPEERMPTPRAITRKLLKTAIAAAEDKKAQDTLVLELDEADSSLTDYFLITSATNQRQAVAIADEIELRLKREHGVYAHSVEGRRLGDWILLDYVDFVAHIFLAEKRAFYDIERLRKSAQMLRPESFSRAEKAKPAKNAGKKPARKQVKQSKKSVKPETEKKAAKKAPAKKTAKKPAKKAAKKPAKKAVGKKPVKVAKKAVKPASIKKAKKSAAKKNTKR